MYNKNQKISMMKRDKNTWKWHKRIIKQSQKMQYASRARKLWEEKEIRLQEEKKGRLTWKKMKGKGQLYEEVMKTCNVIWISENVENGLEDVPDREKVDKLKLQLKARKCVFGEKSKMEF